MRFLPLAVTATLLAGCTRPDNFYCPPPDQEWWCQSICMVQLCDGNVLQKEVSIRLCAGDERDTVMAFWLSVRAPNSGLSKCMEPLRIPGSNPG